ncbi:helix-turn-helix domain-containing protein [Nocardia rhamnosiphila]
MGRRRCWHASSVDSNRCVGPPGDIGDRGPAQICPVHGVKLNLADVAATAKVSRPTLCRFFSSKDELLAAFGR